MFHRTFTGHSTDIRVTASCSCRCSHKPSEAEDASFLTRDSLGSGYPTKMLVYLCVSVMSTAMYSGALERESQRWEKAASWVLGLLPVRCGQRAEDQSRQEVGLPLLECSDPRGEPGLQVQGVLKPSPSTAAALSPPLQPTVSVGSVQAKDASG